MIMKKFSKVIAVFMLILTASLIVPETTVPYYGTVDVQAATKLSKTKGTLIKGQTLTLKLGTIKYSKIKWTSSKKSVAIISSKGKITAKSKGSTIITAKYKNKKYTCKITVETPAINKKSASIYVGDTVTLKMNGTTQSISWSSSNKAVATVSSKGVVKGVEAGSATITAKVGGKKYTCKVTVKEVKVKSSIQVPDTPLSLKYYYKEFNHIYSKSNITNITTNVYESESRVDFLVTIDGIKTYDDSGDFGNTFVKFTVVLYDSNNSIVSSWQAYQSNIIVNQNFSVYKWFENLKPGTYTLKIFDYAL